MKRSPLVRVENLIRRVVEEPFTWLGNGSLDPFQLATHLSKYYESPNEKGEVPHGFTVFINPNDFVEIGDGSSTLQKQVEDYVVLMTGRLGYHLNFTPTVTLEPHPQEKLRSAHIIVSYEETPVHVETAIYSAAPGDGTQEAIAAADAFLIVQGRQHISLDRPIIRIGRRIDNDIVLDMPAISRYHAQIRWRQRYFVLYDVSSHGRTFVNGQKAREYILRPGDVIALSDIFLVYGEGREDVLASPAFPHSDEMESTQLKPEE